MNFRPSGAPGLGDLSGVTTAELPTERTSPPCSLHEVAPYIGKMRPELAAWAIERVSTEGDTIYDPFCGSGTVLLEGALRGRRVIGADLNPYAELISRAKLSLLSRSKTPDWEKLVNSLAPEVERHAQSVRVAGVPGWVKDFYHPETLRNIIAWRDILLDRGEVYLLTCLLAIAHHQRPGFLSYPASHTVPYLRTNKFPKSEYPALYEEREVASRLIKKAKRSSRYIPSAPSRRKWILGLEDAATWRPPRRVDAIITSPPYMGQLHYARDNRLRLWLLGYSDWEMLDKEVSPYAQSFVEKMVRTFQNWSHVLKRNGTLAILVGDTSNSSRQRLDKLIFDISQKADGAFRLVELLESSIPESRRARKGCEGSKAEALIILKKEG